MTPVFTDEGSGSESLGVAAASPSASSAPSPNSRDVVVEVSNPLHARSVRGLSANDESFDSRLASRQLGQAETISLAALKRDLTVRSNGLDGGHVTSLAQADWPLEPILVHRSTMQIVDGHHRVAAAHARGMDTISAYLFDGPLDMAVLLALRANVTHGLPLSTRDRRTAATHLLGRYGDWSDRAIAAATGLSAKAVGKIRRATADDPQLTSRVGQDGR